VNLRDYEIWLCEQQWNGYPLSRMLCDALPQTRDDDHRAYDALRSLTIITNGLGGESGEATEHFKKLVRDGAIDKIKAGIELGDVLAYMTWLAATLGFTLEDIAQLNFEKLTARGRKHS
jgi:NTP pyrophosphatase (non-canonical NTP hydrolase)